MFSDIIQEILEDELDHELGYEKNDRVNKSTDNWKWLLNGLYTKLFTVSF